MVKEGKAEAVIGAGSTGGVVASALQVLGTVEGISRPVAELVAFLASERASYITAQVICIDGGVM